MNCEKILNLFRSELVTDGPKLFATALEQQGYRAIQVNWKPLAGGDKEMQEILELLGGVDE